MQYLKLNILNYKTDFKLIISKTRRRITAYQDITQKYCIRFLQCA